MPFIHLSTKGSKRVVAVQPYWEQLLSGKNYEAFQKQHFPGQQ